MILKDKFWLWGQTAGSHHAEDNNLYNLPGVNKMSPLEGAEFLGISNMCRVVMEDKPAPPFDNEAEQLTSCKNVAWSILGSGGSARNNDGGNDLDEVIRLSKKYPNIMAGIMDDFMRESRMETYPPSVIKEYRKRLHTEAPHPLELWTVIYEHELITEAGVYLEECDVITLWTWLSENLIDLENNLAKLKSLFTSDKKVMVGCYMWDYGNHKPMSMDSMKYQLEVYKQWLLSGKIEGVIFCSNCIADLGLDTVEYARQWIAENSEV